MFADFPSISFQQWMLCGGLAVVVIALVAMSLARARPRDGSPKQYRREIDGANRESEALQRDLEALIGELNELAGGISRQLDAKFAALTTATEVADRRIGELQRLLERVESVGAIPAPIDLENEATATEAVERSNAESSYVDWIINDEAAVALRNQPDEIITLGNPETLPEPAVETQMDEVDSLHRRICELAAQGHRPVEIARIVEHAVGEVELILHLHRRAMRQSVGPG